MLTTYRLCDNIFLSGTSRVDTHCTREPSVAGKTDLDAHIGTAHGVFYAQFYKI